MLVGCSWLLLLLLLWLLLWLLLLLLLLLPAVDAAAAVAPAAALAAACRTDAALTNFDSSPVWGLALKSLKFTGHDNCDSAY